MTGEQIHVVHLAECECQVVQCGLSLRPSLLRPQLRALSVTRDDIQRYQAGH